MSPELELPCVLASKYRIDERIGEGGMGIVYAGEHLELRTRVAIKVLQPKLSDDPSARARFLREARLAATIVGEHSARIHDFGTSDVGRPYIVMEYLRGEPVDARLARDGRVPVQEAATIVVQLLDALAEAHAKGLVHRDLKPANLFLVEKPGEDFSVKVLDFGISKVTAVAISSTTPSITLTEPRTLLGSPQYMSPEQLRGSPSVDARSDLWACGVVLHELVSGKVPFDGATLADLCAQIVSGEPPALPTVGARGVPAPIARIVERCLRKAEAERPQSAYELAVALAPYANESTRALLPRIRAWCSVDDALPEPAPRRRRLMGGLGLVAVAATLAFAAASFRVSTVETAHGTSDEPQTLEPIAPLTSSVPRPADTATSAAMASAPPAPGASASAVSARPRRAPPTPPRSKRIQDLDGIDLIP